MPSGRRPVLVTNPVDDGAFATVAQELLDEGILELDAFRGRLRVSYPNAEAHPREIVGEPIVIWYVYREGHWVNAGTAARPEGA